MDRRSPAQGFLVPRPVVLISGNDPSHGTGGHSCYVRAHGRALLVAGFDPHIFCVSAQEGRADMDYGRLHRVASPFRPFRHLMALFHAPLLISAVVRFLEPQPGPHLIHGIQVWCGAAVRAARRLNASGAAAIAVGSTYDTLLHESRAKLASALSSYSLCEQARQSAETVWNRLVSDRYEAHAYRQASAVFVNYETVRRLLRDSYGPDVPVRKLPYASEAAFFDDPPSSERTPAGESPLILAASRHDPRKGLAVLLRALARVNRARHPFHACMIGHGRLLADHRRLAISLGLEDVMRIEGFVPDSQTWMRRADIFVLPSLEEGSGSLSLLEAMQAGAAIVATNVDGIPEDITDGQTGLLVNPGDEFALAHAIERLLGNEPLRRQLAANARRSFIARFASCHLVSALAAEYARFGVTP